MLRLLPVENREDGGAEGMLLACVELAVFVLFAWTLSYHLCLLLSLPAQWVAAPFLVFFGGLIWYSAPGWRAALRGASGSWGLVAVTLTVGAALGLLSLIASRPDGDDVQYFHRALLQLGLLDQPFLETEEIHDVAGMLLTWVMTISSYETLVAMGAHFFGVDPLFAFHNLVPVAASALVAPIYVLIFRQFGVGRKFALAAAVGAFIFLLVDGNVHQSFGNMAFLRLWQGKALLFTLLIPLGVLASHRYLERPGPRRYLLVFATAVAAAGSSSSGLFLLPAMIFAVSCAFMLTHGVSRQNLKRAAVLNLASTYSTCITLAMVFDLLPTYALEERYASWGATWVENLGLVVGGGFSWLRDLLMLLVLPAFLLPVPHRRFLVLLSLVLMVLFTNPLTGPLFLDVLSPGAYWRIAYLFPLPLCAGLLAQTFSRDGSALAAPRLRVGLASLALLSIVLAFEHTTLSPGSGMPQVWQKRPAEYRFPPREHRFSSAVADTLDGRHLLAPESIIQVLPLLNTTLRLECARSFQTRFAFTSMGRAHEGQQRFLAQQLVTDCRETAGRVSALEAAVGRGVDAVVIGPCHPAGRARLERLLGSFDTWSVSHESEGYTLLLRVAATGRLEDHKETVLDYAFSSDLAGIEN